MPPIDIRYLCSSGLNQSTHDTKIYVFPEIGTIKMTNTCIENTASGADTTFYTATLSTTNIQLPK